MKVDGSLYLGVDGGIDAVVGRVIVDDLYSYFGDKFVYGFELKVGSKGLSINMSKMKFM